MVKTVDKYAQLKRIYRDNQLQFHMYDFMCVYLEKIPEEDSFPETKTSVENYKKRSTPVPVPKYWLRFSYICSEYYQLYLNFDETEMRIKLDNSPKK